MLPITGTSSSKTSTRAIDVVASIPIAPVASTSALKPMYAFVVSTTTLTATAAPTAVLPSAPLRARLWRPTGLEAARSIPPGFDVMTTFDPVEAMLSNTITWTPTEPATLTLLDVPPDAARPQTTNSFVSSVAVIAFRVTPWPVMWAPSAIVARLCTVATLTPTATPTLALPELINAVPIALALPSVWFVASTLTEPVLPMIVSGPVTNALLSSTITLTAIEAATPTPLL